MQGASLSQHQRRATGGLSLRNAQFTNPPVEIIYAWPEIMDRSQSPPITLEWLAACDRREEMNLCIVVVYLMEEALSGRLFADYGSNSRFQISVLQEVFSSARKFFFEVFDHLTQILTRHLRFQLAVR
jgi:hypothetical protein